MTETHATSPTDTGAASERSGRQRVLVIDDDRDLVKLIVMVLSRIGFDVAGAGEGEEGLALFQQLQPAVVILDVNLPGVNGWTVLRRLRQISQVPIIMLTVMASREDQRLGLALGAADYITKPFLPKTLLTRVLAVTAS
jgi:DNA-binding response OmpR family regulator